jgi:hypothetical protein
MSEENDKFGFIDWDSRAREIIRDLIRDGYPESDQIVIPGCLCMVIARDAADDEQLMSLAASSVGLIGLGCKTCFKPRSDGGESRDQHGSAGSVFRRKLGSFVV